LLFICIVVKKYIYSNIFNIKQDIKGDQDELSQFFVSGFLEKNECKILTLYTLKYTLGIKKKYIYTG